jgi:hypothetical protein
MTERSAVNGRSLEFSYGATLPGTTPERITRLLQELSDDAAVMVSVIARPSSLVGKLFGRAATVERLESGDAVDMARVAAALVRGDRAFIGLRRSSGYAQQVLARHGYRQIGESPLSAGAKHLPLLGPGYAHFDRALQMLVQNRVQSVLHSAHDADPMFVFTL